MDTSIASDPAGAMAQTSAGAAGASACATRARGAARLVVAGAALVVAGPALVVAGGAAAAGRAGLYAVIASMVARNAASGSRLTRLGLTDPPRVDRAPRPDHRYAVSVAAAR